MRVQWWENKKIRPVLLSRVLPWCVREHGVDTLLLVSRSATRDHKTYSFDRAVDKKAVTILGANLIEQLRASGWPGTQVWNNSDKVYVARFDAALMRKLIAIENSLFDWLHWPNKLPEDLCVFRQGADYPALVSFTLDRDAYLLSKKSLPPPPGFEKSDLRLEKFIWSGPYFCRTTPAPKERWLRRRRKR